MSDGRPHCQKGTEKESKGLTVNIDPVVRIDREKSESTFDQSLPKRAKHSRGTLLAGWLARRRLLKQHSNACLPTVHHISPNSTWMQWTAHNKTATWLPTSRPATESTRSGPIDVVIIATWQQQKRDTTQNRK